MHHMTIYRIVHRDCHGELIGHLTNFTSDRDLADQWLIAERAELPEGEQVIRESHVLELPEGLRENPTIINNDTQWGKKN